MIEKYCLSLVIATHKLQHYMMTYSIQLVARHDPLRYLCLKTALLGHCAKWQVLLSEYDITYVPHKAVKAQVLADQLAEQPLFSPILDPDFPDNDINNIGNGELDPDEEDTWKLFFNGAVSKKGSGIGVVLEDPSREQLPVAHHLHFVATNNVVEYETCILGLIVTKAQGADRLHVFRDSLLIISQTNGEWKTRNEKLIPYQERLTQLVKGFEKIKFTYLKQSHNSFANALATLASWINV